MNFYCWICVIACALVIISFLVREIRFDRFLQSEQERFEREQEEIVEQGRRKIQDAIRRGAKRTDGSIE